MADSVFHASAAPVDVAALPLPAAPAAEAAFSAAPEASITGVDADASHRGSSDASAPPTGEVADDLRAQLSDSVALFVDGVEDLNGITVRSARDALEASAQLAIFETGVPEFKAALREALMHAVQQRMKREAPAGAVAAETANGSDGSNEDSSDDSDSASDGSSSEDEDGDQDEEEAGEGAAAAGDDGTLRRPKKKRNLAGAGDASSSAGSSTLARPRKGGSVFSKPMALTAPLAEFFGVDRLARGEASKRLWAYIKEKGLPKNARGQYVCDAAMEAAFKRKTMDFKSASKGLAAGMKDPDLLVDGGAAAGTGSAATRRGAASGSRAASSSSAAAAQASPGSKRTRPATDAPASGSRSARGTPAKRPRAGGEGSATSGGGGSGGFNKPVPLSVELAAFMGEPTASRTGVTKALWAHIKAAGLQKEGNRSIIVLDAKMAPLFPGVAEIGMFGMNKGLARHFKPAQ
jgi:chromatin remodeling complex protein RSC6